MYLFPHAAPDVPNGPIGAAEGQGRIVGATTVLFHQGDRAEDLYEVVSGVFRATKVFQDGRRQVVAFAYPGDVIGFGHGDLYRFDCDALTPAKVQITARGQIGDAIGGGLGAYGIYRKTRRPPVPADQKAHFVNAQPQVVSGQMIAELARSE